VEIARNGYVIASMEYRNTDDGFRFPAQIEDAKTAIRFLKEHSEEYQIDVDRIAVWGDSSGAHTALMAGITDDEQFSSEKDSKTAAHVKCIIDFYGPSDFMLMDQWPDDFPSIMGSWGEKEPLHMLFGGKKEESLALMKKASPLEYITKGKAIPPVLIMHGDKDAMVLLHQSVLLYRKLRETGHEVEFYVVRNAAHGFNFWTQRTVSVVTDFLNAYL
jgi:acetyl esterase/lipase